MPNGDEVGVDPNRGEVEVGVPKRGEAEVGAAPEDGVVPKKGEVVVEADAVNNDEPELGVETGAPNKDGEGDEEEGAKEKPEDPNAGVEIRMREWWIRMGKRRIRVRIQLWVGLRRRMGIVWIVKRRRMRKLRIRIGSPTWFLSHSLLLCCGSESGMVGLGE